METMRGRQCQVTSRGNKGFPWRLAFSGKGRCGLEEQLRTWGQLQKTGIIHLNNEQAT